MKKLLKVIALLLLVIIAAATGYVLIYFPPVMTGMDAKTMCSCVYVTGRTPESVKAKELQVFPGLTLADFVFNESDSSVSASLLWKTSTAIYRKGLGCTLLSERSEEEVRSQKLRAPALQSPELLDSIPWPRGNMTDSASIPGVDYAALNAAINNAFNDDTPSGPVNTHAVVILYDGKIIGERYAEGMDKNTRLMGWSMTKSIGNALIGILVRYGKLSPDRPAPWEEWKDDERRRITLDHLLKASSGLQWNESYFVPTSEFHRMFIHSDDKAGFAAALPLEHEPGTHFQYSSGTSNILAGIVRKTVGDNDYYQFPYRELFQRIGMYTALLEPDASGTFVGSSYGYASARDWARLGLLYLNDGIFEGERILPEGWVDYSLTPAPACRRGEYGAQIWLNRGNPKDPSNRFIPGLPQDAFFFEGFERNSVTVIPSRKLVAVRLGVTHHSGFQLHKFVSDVIEALPSEDLAGRN